MEYVIDITNEVEKYDLSNEMEKIEKYISEILDSEIEDSIKDIYLSLMFTDIENIQKINKEYRDKDMATDVISFAYSETENAGFYNVLGDIVICLEVVDDNSKKYGHGFERELYYVITHGVLHLLGYDHINEDEKKEMREKEEYYLNKFGYRR
ncbi:rRNA maturation RNase YbeY [Haliovirga abyssi]|uniref:Endoribonuclease YbeY n=1 Tax=Haliovirga abyssi TaxID=2996794 RepID=A0AAU9DW40_9FUSO|nr:rRNA maturation RNase YbeY [Haliovirga abyssi]BDU50461.1 endoribonuclease YbeY [Haliovirga abyssi]